MPWFRVVYWILSYDYYYKPVLFHFKFLLVCMPHGCVASLHININYATLSLGLDCWSWRIRSALVGNDFKKLYKQGRFEEALALYDRAIAIDSKKATYHCNKSAALISLGRFLQAIVECEEAIRLEPSYGRAHTHLATIYFRYSTIIIIMCMLHSICYGLV